MALVDNTKKIFAFLEQHAPTEGDGFYKFDILVRAKDNPDNEFMKFHKGSFLVRSYVIKTAIQYRVYLDEMISLCNKTGARLYMTVDQKSTEKMAVTLSDTVHDMLKGMLRNNTLSTKNLFNIMNSTTSKSDVSIHGKKHVLLDVDTRDEALLNNLLSRLDEANVKNRIILDSYNGYHILIPKTVPMDNLKRVIEPFEDVEVKENALTLVYYNDGKD